MYYGIMKCILKYVRNYSFYFYKIMLKYPPQSSVLLNLEFYLHFFRTIFLENDDFHHYFHILTYHLLLLILQSGMLCTSAVHQLSQIQH